MNVMSPPRQRLRSSARRTSYATLTASTCAAKDARRLIGRAVANWRLPQDRTGDLDLIVTELVANALRHAGRSIALGLSYDRPTSTFRIEVMDGSDAPPVLEATTDVFADSGRGLRLIDAYADAWGHRARPDGPGKTVWAEVSLHGSP